MSSGGVWTFPVQPQHWRFGCPYIFYGAQTLWKLFPKETVIRPKAWIMLRMFQIFRMKRRFNALHWNSFKLTKHLIIQKKDTLDTIFRFLDFIWLFYSSS